MYLWMSKSSTIDIKKTIADDSFYKAILYKTDSKEFYLFCFSVAGKQHWAYTKLNRDYIHKLILDNMVA